MSNKAELNDNENKAAKRNRQEQEGVQNDGRAPIEGDANVSELTHLQQTVGNQAVQAMMVQRKGGGKVSDETAEAIKSAKGGGKPLEKGLASQMEKSFGADFSGVRVHTDDNANQIAADIQAKAFTTGKDIFFAKGQYDPKSEKGQELIAHELTHVVQQSGGSAPSMQRKMTVNDPNDKYEAEADKVAEAVVAKKDAQLQRAEEEEVQMKEEGVAQAKAIETLQRSDDDDDDVQAKADASIQREEAGEEEEEVQAKADETVQRAGEEEEEENAGEEENSMEMNEGAGENAVDPSKGEEDMITEDKSNENEEEEEEMQAKADDAIQREPGQPGEEEEE
ncbi:MAG: DUF4157 domain-containing protein [Chloroflexota bacterium]